MINLQKTSTTERMVSMSKTTVAIQKIRQDLDSISGLDGIVGDWAVFLSEKIHKDVLDILNNHPEANLFNYCGKQYWEVGESTLNGCRESNLHHALKTCATCQYGKPDDLGDRICTNVDSENCADWVGDDDTCECWEESHDKL